MWQPHSPNSRHESRGEAAGTSRGTQAVDGGTNVKGTWVNLGSATSFAYEAVTVCLSRNSGAADFMVDIGISDGSNRFVLIADLHFAAIKLINEQSVQIYVPVHVPAGAQLSARAASSSTISGVDVALIGHAAGVGGVPGFSRCVALFTPASSRGIAIDPGGTANTKGAWAEMSASCPADIGAMFGLIGYNGDVARVAAARALIDIGLGAASSEYVLYPNATLGWGTVRDGPANCPRIPIFACNVAKTTRVVARSACSVNTASDRTIDLALYGLIL